MSRATASRKLPKEYYTPEVDIHNRNRKNAKEVTLVQAGSLSSPRPPSTRFRGGRRSRGAKRTLFLQPTNVSPATQSTNPRTRCSLNMTIKTRQHGTHAMSTPRACGLSTGGHHHAKDVGTHVSQVKQFDSPGDAPVLTTEYLTERANTAVF